MIATLLIMATSTPLQNLDLALMQQDWGTPQINKSVDKNELRIAGVGYPQGVGTHASSSIFIQLEGRADRIVAFVGVDDETQGKGSVEFQVWVDAKLAFSSGVMRGGERAKKVDVDLKGAKTLWLYVDPADSGIDYDHANWANAVIYHESDKAPIAAAFPQGEDLEVAMTEKLEPEIHGPRIIGCSPNKPFLFRIPATGKATLKYRSKGLPKGLRLDEKTGIIHGSIEHSSEHRVALEVSNTLGSDFRELSIICGNGKLALTPPMGWNSWNVWGTSVDAEKVRAAADAFEKTGLADYGYQFINIDDAWEGQRDANGVLQTNEKFGDMRSLAAYVHSKGLKLGIYSSPGPKTCAGYEGSYGFEEIDAKTWADWGIDYLKYDWCSYGQLVKNPDLKQFQAPYAVMRKALDGVHRDIVYSLCQYGMGAVWDWGSRVGGDLWRTTGDITDTWGSMSGIGFGEADRNQLVGPSNWNDPDMLVVGMLGWSSQTRPTRLTKNEQITHITLWAMSAAPLLIGCDLTQLDPFTKAILCNHDVIEIDQDPLGKPGKRVWKSEATEVWVRPLFDGSHGVAVFNRGPFERTIELQWPSLGLSRNQTVYDCWTRKEMGSAKGFWKVTVPGHGAKLFRVRSN